MMVVDASCHRLVVERGKRMLGRSPERNLLLFCVSVCLELMLVSYIRVVEPPGRCRSNRGLSSRCQSSVLNEN